MKAKYFIESKQFNVLGDDLHCELCEHESNNKIMDWAQPHFQRSYNTKMFFTEYEALDCLKRKYPDKLLTVLEETGRVVATQGHESYLTSMIIKKESYL